MKTKSKEARIRDELNRLSELFADVEDDKRSVVGPLLQNAAFMRITLEDLQEVVNTDGVVDEYKNGANQFGYKPSATLQSYNSLIKNYTSVVKTLAQFLPYKKSAPVPSPWAPQEKTEEEREEEKRQWEEHQRELAELNRLAVVYQQEQREADAAGIRHFPSFSIWVERKKAEEAAIEEAAADMRSINGDD